MRRSWFGLLLIVPVLFTATGTSRGDDRPREAPRPAAAADRVPVPEPSQRALEFYRSGNVLWAIFQLVGLALPAVILFTGLSGRLRNLAQRIGRKWFFTVAIYYLFYALIVFLVTLPLDFYAGFLRLHDYGLSNQSLDKWLSDAAISLGIGLAGGCLLLWVPYLLLRLAPRRWWLYTSLLSIPLMIVVMLVEPIWIAPLYNHFGPMENKQLEADILRLAERAGIEGSRVFEVDKSVDTKAVNAYVTGVFGSKRIVLWDTLLKRLDRDEVLDVMAHEMGHYVLHHIFWGIGVGFLAALVGLYAVHRLSGALISRFKDRFGFDRLSDVASLPLVMLLLGLVSLVLSPAVLAASRTMERQADRFGLELTQNNHAMATAFVKLQQENLGNPRPGWFYVLWRASHPTLAERIEFANDYRPWETGLPLRFGAHFVSGEGTHAKTQRREEERRNGE